MLVLVNQERMNMTTSNSSNALLTVPYQLNIWFGSFLWITCNLGSIGNLIVFCSRSLRHRAYSVYLLFQAIMDIFYYNSVLLTRILERGFQIPISNRYDIMCKLRQFFSVWGNQVSFSLFLLATVDRLLSAQRSNSKYKQILLSIFTIIKYRSSSDILLQQKITNE